MKALRSLGSLILVAATTTAAFGQPTQPTVSSSNATITYGQAFTPAFYGGAGNGNWQFCIGGYTNWSPGTNGPAGTDVPGVGWRTSWTPPAVGTYGYYVAKCGDGTWNTSNYAGWYYVTVNKAPMQAPTSSSATISVGQSWAPSISAPASNGSGQLLFSVAGQTYWGSAAWTPSAAGTYSFYVSQKADGNHYGNNNDPAQGEIHVNGNAYTVTVIKQNQSTVSISPSTMATPVNNYVTLYASGGSGNGAYVWGGAASGTGSSKTVWFGTYGSHNVTVYRAGDSTYNDSNTATAVVRAYRFMWAFNPGSPVANSQYNVSVGVDTGGFPGVTLYKNGSYMAFGWFGTQANTQDPQGQVNYSASFSDSMYSFGASDSRPITVGPGLIISSHPSSVTAPQGGNVTFTVSASGPGTLSYQWQKDYSNISGATSSSYVINGVTASHAGNYRCVVSSSPYNLTVESNSATLTVNTPPVFSTHPQPQTVNAGANVTFTAVASNSPTYQWYFNNSPIANATAASYSLSNVQSGNAGTYRVRATSNGLWTDSNDAALTVNSQFTVSASVSPTNAGTVTGAGVHNVNAQATLTATAAAGYSFSSWSGTITSSANPLQFTVTGPVSVTANFTALPLTIGTHPASRSINVGQSATMTVSATGPGTLSYQWQKNEVNIGNGGSISGVTTATISFTNAQLADAGSYRCVVQSSAGGSATSNSATLTVTGSTADIQLNIHLPN